MQSIEFRTGDAFLLRHARPMEATTAERTIRACLHLPTFGSGPFPAVVLSQGLSGVSVAREHRYAKLLAEHGIAALVFDSFAARSRSRLADPFKALQVSETMLLGDAFAALSHLAARPDIRAADIAIVGFSYGGMIAVLAAYRQIAETFLPDGPRFSRHVAYYGCSIPRLDDPTTTGAPVTMLIGEKDRNVDLTRTRVIAEDLRAGGSKVDLTLYPDLYHQWDDADAGHKFVLLELAGCRMRVTRENRIVDERTGLSMRGWWTRSAILALSCGLTGYHTKPDAEATAISDAHLLAALAGRDTGPSRPPKKFAAAPHRAPDADFARNAGALVEPVAGR
ncbi:MAG: dienelactone hydrolase family protein [Rhizobiaceae bacterium]|nr:dienelactone hydrolase family protein [Rhizobiaceae bacterium]